MARDIFATEHRCPYCGRPGVERWDDDLLSCRHELCKSLAFAETARRHPYGRRRRGLLQRAGAVR